MGDQERCDRFRQRVTEDKNKFYDTWSGVVGEIHTLAPVAVRTENENNLVGF